MLEYLGEVLTEEAYRQRVAMEYADRTHYHCINLDHGLVIDGGIAGRLPS